ncbi:hypothetical protein, partial [Aquabacterium sp.]|uniref:hypothetical protein n=1 Tax=Aquabacterium sp. TaxID=1872578 RepID=UPI0025C6FF38
SSGDGRTGSQNNQESGTTSGSGSGAGDSGKVQGKPRQEDGNHPNGEGGSAPTDTPPKRHGYVYKTVAIGTEWKSCEFTREGAQTWARRGLESEASRACALLGPGWGRDKIEFPGYEQALVCSGGNKWRYKITDAIARCQKME